MNLYQYVVANPVNLVDPLGLWLGFDDIITGPVDEILVIGGLSLAAWLGSQAADDFLQKILKKISSLSSSTGCPDPCEELAKEIKKTVKDIRGAKRNIREHIDKLNKYRKDPLSMDNKGSLAKALDSGNHDLAETIYKGRQKALLSTIYKHMSNGKKYTEKLKKQMQEWKIQGC